MGHVADTNQQPLHREDAVLGGLPPPGGHVGRNCHADHKFAIALRLYVQSTFSIYTTLRQLEPTYYGQGAATNSDQLLLRPLINTVQSSDKVFKKCDRGREYDHHLPEQG